MTDYNTLSDFEINKLVVEALGCEVVYTDSSRVGIRGTQTGNPLVVDYCNNPLDAWPVIAESEIDVQFRQGAKCPPMARHINFYCVDKNPLRAAMIVFLMMNEVENETKNT